MDILLWYKQSANMLWLKCEPLSTDASEELHTVNENAQSFSYREAMNTAWCQFSQTMEQWLL